MEPLPVCRAGGSCLHQCIAETDLKSTALPHWR